MWRRDDGGVEHVSVAARADGGMDVDGVAVWDSHRVAYRLVCDAQWRVREVDVVAPEDETALRLRADGHGRWHDGTSGAALPHLDGCIDVDLWAIAFTNTLPVRRLGLRVAEARLIDVAYVRLPSMAVDRMEQRYTRVADRVYRYESVVSGFTADLILDEEGLVVEYPGLVRRMWARRQ